MRAQKEFPLTEDIKILEYGRGDEEGVYVKLASKHLRSGSYVLLRIDDGINKEFGRLIRAGIHVVDPAAQRELVRRIQMNRPEAFEFSVATRPGWNGDEFVFSGDVISSRERALSIPHFDDKVSGYGNKFRCEGVGLSVAKNFKHVARLAVGNTRLMLGLALAFVGPCFRIFHGDQPGFQFSGDPEGGKTTIGMAAGSVWGRRQDGKARLGFLENWNITPNELDIAAVGHNNTLLILDETRTIESGATGPSQGILDFVMRHESGIEKGRLTSQTAARSWQVPVLSTSNRGLDELCRGTRTVLDDAHRGRMIDIPAPTGGYGFFEDLKGYGSGVELSDHLKQVARANYGWAGRCFVENLVDWIGLSEAEVTTFFEERRAAFLRHANRIAQDGRDLNRIRGHFATVYAAGGLAIKFGILPWTRKELRAALLTCFRDHLAFVELHRAPSVVRQSSVSLAKLVAFIEENSSYFPRLRSGVQMPDASPRGFLLKVRGAECFAFTTEQFAEIAGDEVEAARLKKQLLGMDVLKTSGTGKQRKMMVRGPKVDGARLRLVAIDGAILKR